MEEHKFHIPMLDLARLHATMEPELRDSFQRILKNSAFILGKELEAFEEECRKFFEVKHAIGVANGTDAIILILLAAGIGEGDEVITSALSAFASAEAILRTGAKPVFVDIDERTFTLDPKKIESAITSKTKAIMPVSLYGLPADLDAILTIAKKHSLGVIEDCAQSFGAKWGLQYTGTLGLAGSFSFFPSKNLGGFGDGGMVVTNDDKIAEKIRVLRNHGEEGERFRHAHVGFNSRLDGLQAALLRVKLKYLIRHNDERRAIGDYYNRELKDSGLILPVTPEGYQGEHAYHLYVIREPGGKRDSLREYLARKGIASNVHYPIPLHLQPAIASKISLPIVERVVGEILSIPIFPLMRKNEMEEVVYAIKAWRK